MKRVDSLVAQRPYLGWMLSGKYDAHSKSKGGSQFLCVGNVSEKLVRSLWELDAIGISSVGESKDGLPDTFHSSISYEGGRYIAGLPWKAKGKHNLFNNKESAEKRILSLPRRLAAHLRLKEAYDENLSEMENSGIIIEVNDGSSAHCRDLCVIYLTGPWSERTVRPLR